MSFILFGEFLEVSENLNKHPFILTEDKRKSVNNASAKIQLTVIVIIRETDGVYCSFNSYLWFYCLC